MATAPVLRDPLLPQAKVVKALNTPAAGPRVEPTSLSASSSLFVSGDDEAAEGTVVHLLQTFGHDDVIDLGGIESARPTEMRLPMRLRLISAPGACVKASGASTDHPEPPGHRLQAGRTRGQPIRVAIRLLHLSRLGSSARLVRRRAAGAFAPPRARPEVPRAEQRTR